jgi:uncharacterized membrane protein YdbT with pleckstrin-like domain
MRAASLFLPSRAITASKDLVGSNEGPALLATHTSDGPLWQMALVTCFAFIAVADTLIATFLYLSNVSVWWTWGVVAMGLYIVVGVGAIYARKHARMAVFYRSKVVLCSAWNLHQISCRDFSWRHSMKSLLSTRAP